EDTLEREAGLHVVVLDVVELLGLLQRGRGRTGAGRAFIDRLRLLVDHRLRLGHWLDLLLDRGPLATLRFDVAVESEGRKQPRKEGHCDEATHGSTIPNAHSLPLQGKGSFVQAGSIRCHSVPNGHAQTRITPRELCHSDGPAQNSPSPNTRSVSSRC